MTTAAFPQKRILVVDDEPLICYAVKMMLQHDGHVVETAGSAEDALTLLEKGKFDLVITDYKMPGMTGDELALAIKALDPAQLVIMITAYAEMLKSAEHSLEGIDYILSKPFLMADLRTAIATVTPPPAAVN
jgi:CheY-like chemotaxis protein